MQRPQAGGVSAEFKEQRPSGRRADGSNTGEPAGGVENSELHQNGMLTRE